MIAAASALLALLASGLEAPRARQTRCGLLHAIIGLPHSGAKRAFKDLDCVRAARRGRSLLVRGSVTDDTGTRPLLAPGETCTEGYVGADVRRLSRGRGPIGFVELRLTPGGPDRFAFSVLLDTWGGAATGSAGARCGASGEGMVSRSGGGWHVTVR